jgi:hypothetical protein
MEERLHDHVVGDVVREGELLRMTAAATAAKMRTGALRNLSRPAKAEASGL